MQMIINLCFLNGLFFTEFVDGRVHYEGRFIGEEASIPCEVNFEGCGQIYFLTWSKNVSSGWQRVFLYSETYQTAMGDFEASRVTLDASNITSHGLAVLNLKSVSIDDEGTYKCDVTYLQGSCPSLTYTKLFTLGKIIYKREENTFNGRKMDRTRKNIPRIACPNQRQLVYFFFSCLRVTRLMYLPLPFSSLWWSGRNERERTKEKRTKTDNLNMSHEILYWETDVSWSGGLAREKVREGEKIRHFRTKHKKDFNVREVEAGKQSETKKETYFHI